MCEELVRLLVKQAGAFLLCLFLGVNLLDYRADPSLALSKAINQFSEVVVP